MLLDHVDAAEDHQAEPKYIAQRTVAKKGDYLTRKHLADAVFSRGSAMEEASCLPWRGARRECHRQGAVTRVEASQ